MSLPIIGDYTRYVSSSALKNAQNFSAFRGKLNFVGGLTESRSFSNANTTHHTGTIRHNGATGNNQYSGQSYGYGRTTEHVERKINLLKVGTRQFTDLGISTPGVYDLLELNHEIALVFQKGDESKILYVKNYTQGMDIDSGPSFWGSQVLVVMLSLFGCVFSLTAVSNLSSIGPMPVSFLILALLCWHGVYYWSKKISYGRRNYSHLISAL